MTSVFNLARYPVLIAVLFVGEAAGGLGKADGMLAYGLAIGAVVAAIALAIWVFQRVSVEDEERVHELFEERHKEKAHG